MVTGAARGIGQAIAVGLARQGATVVNGDVGDLAETSKLTANVGNPAVAHRWISATELIGTSGHRRGGGNPLIFVVYAHSGGSYRALVSRGDWLPGTPAQTCPQHSYEGWNRA